MSTYTDSLTAEASLTLQGVWIHDPQDPEGTIQQYLYGKASKSSSIDTMQNGLIFTGRQFPVFEYGEHQEDQYDVTIHVPFDTSWMDSVQSLQDFAESRTTVCFRDNRGRRMFGSIFGYKEDDTDAGTNVSFTLSRADYDESVI